jgi:hypothetical protein
VILRVENVTADPPLAFAAAGQGGTTLSAQVFSGQCRLGLSPDEKLMAKLSQRRKLTSLGFYLPDTGPFRPSYLLQAWAEVSLAKTRVSGTNGARGPYGVDDVTVQLVDDGLGSGAQWPYLSFTAHGGQPMTLRYRVTVTQPVE